MIRAFILFFGLLPVAAAAQAPAQGVDSRGLWSDWRSVNAASLEAEGRREGESRRTITAARSLGERVGELVASGDCEGGERMALEAGDFPLVEAVRDFCRTRPRPRS